MIDLTLPLLDLSNTATTLAVAFPNARREAGKLISHVRNAKRVTRAIRRSTALGKVIDDWMDKGGDTDLHVVSHGGMDAIDFVGHVAKRYGPVNLVFCSFACGEESVRHLSVLKSARHIGTVAAFVDSLMFNAARGASARPILKQVCDVLEFGCNHAKLYVCETPQGPFVGIGSCNLSANPRTETLLVSRDRQLATFYSKVIYGQIEKAQQRRGREAGRNGATRKTG